jgi:NAD(P)-dependent dehydrogenase (short-subunit alcohol dehydrogenase family)
MQTFLHRVAVITGAASGIGRGLARRCAREGMQVVLADVEPGALAEAEAELRSMGAPVLSVVTDVSAAQSVEALAKATLDAFGAVHLLFNNAGVGVIRSAWESTLADWHWVLGVNLWGAIHGVHTFVPIMLAQSTECHIVNTSSISGLVIQPGGSATYDASKHAVVALTETLYYELAHRAPHIKVSMLLPGWVDTRIADAERNRPAGLRNDPRDTPAGPDDEFVLQAVRQALRNGMSPDEAAGIVFEAIREDQFYIFTHPEMREWVRAYAGNVIAARNPPL